MVGQSDLPFRCLCRKHGATLAYTQMLIPDKLLHDQDYLEHHLKDLTAAPGMDQPVVIQLCGNDPETVVRAGKKLQNHCQGIGKHSPLRPYSHWMRISQTIRS
jgi:tRNA-dihydrouridine synthase 1